MRKRSRVTVGVVAGLVTALGCADDASLVTLDDDPIMLMPPPDAGGPAIGPDFEPDPPALAAEPEPLGPDPALPVLTPCPEGWLPVAATDAEPVVCMPWSESADPSSCAADEVMWPGTGVCGRLGTECPADGWAAPLPDGDPVVYVDAAAADAGDGSAESPFQSVSDALAAAPAGTVVAVAPGVYPETIEVPGGVTVWGSCVEGTLLEAPDQDGTTVLVTGADAELSNLTVRGGGIGVYASGEDVSLRLADVRIDGAAAAGLAIEGGAQAELERVVIRDLQGTSEGGAGRAVSTSGGTTVRATRLALEGAREASLLAAAGAQVELDGSIIRDTLGRVADQRFGAGVFAQNGAVVTVENSVLERNRGAGAFTAAATVRISDSLVRDTRPEALTGMLGVGLWSQVGTLVLERVLLEGNREAGVYVSGGADSLDATDVVARSTRASTQGGAGIAIFGGATARVERAWLDDNRAFGFYLRDGASATVTDLTVKDTLPSVVDPHGLGLIVRSDATLTLERGRIEGSRVAGVYVQAASAHLQDLQVRGTEGSETEPIAAAVTVQMGAEATLERALLEDNVVIGLEVSGEGTHATASDLVVRQMRGGQAPVLGIGRGISATMGGALELRRSVVEGYRDHGIFCSDPGSLAQVSDVTVRDGIGNPDAPEPRLSGQGRGVVAQLGATVTGERLVVDRSPEVALTVGGGATARICDVLIRDTRPIGSGPLSGLWGRAVNVGGMEGVSSELELCRGHFVGSREVGLAGFNDGTRVTLTDVQIEQTEPVDCSGRTAACLPFGIGLGAYLDARVSASRFRVDHSSLIGVQFARGGTVELADGVVASNPIGLNPQGDEIDYDAFTRNVLFVGNVRNLDAEALPTPGAGVDIGSGM